VARRNGGNSSNGGKTHSDQERSYDRDWDTETSDSLEKSTEDPAENQQLQHPVMR
jgi:hypothetical protein